MRGSRLRYLGLLGFLGLLGLATGNQGFAGYFGFFGFFAFGRYLDDERLALNIGRAARNAFLAGIGTFALVTSFSALALPSLRDAYAMAFGLTFALQLLVFSFSLAAYER